jgi:hypothetical protein
LRGQCDYAFHGSSPFDLLCWTMRARVCVTVLLAIPADGREIVAVFRFNCPHPSRAPPSIP